MNWMSVTYVTWRPWRDMEKIQNYFNCFLFFLVVVYVTGDMEKSQNSFNYFFFQNGKTNYGQALISIEMLLFLETRIASCANVPVTRVSSCLWQLRFSGSSVFTLKTNHCLVIESCKTLSIASKLSKFTKNGIFWK